MTPRVIIADDDEDVLALLEEVMADAGYDVTAVADGAALLRDFGRSAYDVVVTDMRMPHADGMAVLDGVRAIHPGTPVIVITGHSDYDEADLRAKGAACCLRKPLNHLQELPRAVDTALRSARAVP